MPKMCRTPSAWSRSRRVEPIVLFAAMPCPPAASFYQESCRAVGRSGFGSCQLDEDAGLHVMDALGDVGEVVGDPFQGAGGEDEIGGGHHLAGVPAHQIEQLVDEAVIGVVYHVILLGAD